MLVSLVKKYNNSLEILFPNFILDDKQYMVSLKGIQPKILY